MILTAEKRFEQTPMLSYCNDILYEPLIKTRILYLDTETTNLPPTINIDVSENSEDWSDDDKALFNSKYEEYLKDLSQLRAVQIYFKLVENGQVIDTFGTLLNIPEHVEISEGSFRAHGISKDMLEDAPIFSACLPRIRELLRQADCICAYNANFDRMILNKEIHYALRGDQELFCEDDYLEDDIDYLVRPWLDPLVWRRHSKVIRGDRNPFSQNKLDQAAKFYGVSAIAQIKHNKVSLHNAETDVNVLIELTHKMYESGDIPFDLGDCFLSQDKAANKYYEYRDK